MVKADMMYQIDARLKEIKINQEWFGGISVVLMGNILQLQPLKGRYIFEKPLSDTWKTGHQLQSLWDLFLPIKLRGNHRQEGQMAFADMLKRVARGVVNDDDLELLKTRVFPENDPRIPKDTLYVFPLKKMVKEYNEKQLSLLEGDLEVVCATNILSTRKHFDPPVDEADGKVRGTPLISKLYLKRRAKVILIHNVDVPDGLNNGAKGVVLDFAKKTAKLHILS